jgi:hypothetical protein
MLFGQRPVGILDMDDLYVLSGGRLAMHDRHIITVLLFK